MCKNHIYLSLSFFPTSSLRSIRAKCSDNCSTSPSLTLFSRALQSHWSKWLEASLAVRFSILRSDMLNCLMRTKSELYQHCFSEFQVKYKKIKIRIKLPNLMICTNKDLLSYREIIIYYDKLTFYFY